MELVEGEKDMAKNPTKGPNVLDFQDHKENKDLCIFIQKKLAFSIAFKIRQIFRMVQFGLLLLFYLCVITTYIAVMQSITSQPTKNTDATISAPLEKIEIPEMPQIGY